MGVITPEKEKTLPPVEHPWTDGTWERKNTPSSMCCHLFGPKVLWHEEMTLCGEPSAFGIAQELAQDVGGYCLYCGRKRCKRCLDARYS